MGLNNKNYKILQKFSVSRETFYLLEQYKSLAIEKNKEINLISNKSSENFTERHIIDCAQIIDLIDLNKIICTDIGSGAGLPGIVLAILMKDKNIKTRMKLYEKSYWKSTFLREIAKKLKLDVIILDKDIFKEKNLVSGSIVARAFKPLPIILELVEKNFKNYSNLVVFMGKNGKQLLQDSIKKWEFEYKKIRSITSKDSFLINIKNIKKK
tara:strand:+ start:1650 stop:2282 length:633 start_codon:yes stop_codon:yes gene_type:complete